MSKADREQAGNASFAAAGEGDRTRWRSVEGDVRLSTSAGIAMTDRGLARESAPRQQGRWPLWLPVFLGAGIAVYFALPFEPDGRWGVLAAIAGAGLTVLGTQMDRRVTAGALYAAAALLLGFAASVARTNLVEAPVLTRDTGWVEIEGRVAESFVHADGRPRLLIAPSSISGFATAEMPALVRLSLRQDETGWRPGDRVRLRGQLSPPPRPSMPGAFDFGRAAYFDRVGAFGFAAGSPERLAPADNLTVLEEATLAIALLRDRITRRIRDVLPGVEGAIAAALIAGDRSGIPGADLDAMRDSSLAHLLSISGLHMAIVGLGLFGALRLLGSLLPSIALSINLKKAAAAGALAGAFFYLLLSGASVPTQRSFIMIGLMFVAVMLDRSPFSMRIVAISAAAILLWSPESLFDPSFQMSFAAVAAIVAAFESFERWQAGRESIFLARDTWTGRLSMAFVGSLLSSLVAGAASAPYASFHFNRMAIYGVAANLLATPVVTFVIMPMGAAALIAMPLGLDGLPLRIMGWGIGIMLAIAHWVASWPGASIMLESWPAYALGVVTLGGLWLVIWRGSIRIAGLAIAAAGLMLPSFVLPPDLLVEGEGRNAALRAADGSLVLASARRARFAASDWLERDGDGRSPGAARASAEGERLWVCAADVCRSAGDGPPVAVIGPRGDAGPVCGGAPVAVAVSARPLNACFAAALLLSPAQLSRTGAAGIRWSESGYPILDTVRDHTGDRPWSRWGE